MQEELIRQELPIQCVYERGEKCTATVPVHLGIMSLPASVRSEPSLVADAKNIVGACYNEDMEYYLKILESDGMKLPWLRGYEKFNDSWLLEGMPDENGFLALSWRENGNINRIGFCDIPVVLRNQHDEYGNFYTPEYYKKKECIEIIYRGIEYPEVVSMPPEKMMKYGVETGAAKIDLEKGVAEVVAHAFCSEYQENMAKALLLRDFAVFYLNRLLDFPAKRASKKQLQYS